MIEDDSVVFLSEKHKRKLNNVSLTDNNIKSKYICVLLNLRCEIFYLDEMLFSFSFLILSNFEFIYKNKNNAI